LNKNVLSFFKATKDELSFSNLHHFFPQTQPNGLPSNHYFRQFLKIVQQAKPTSFKFTFKKKNGELLNTIIKTVFIKEAFENITVYLFRDITQETSYKRIIKYQLEELDEKNIQLQKYIDNQLQFENFAHLAAHDLKNPLRTLVSFSQILQDSTTNRISEDEKEYIAFIKKAANKVSNLITGLSNFAELNVEKCNFELIDFNMFKTHLKKSLKAKFTKSAYQLTFNQLPVDLIANTRHLHTLFYELISNAITYKKPNEQSFIKVNCIEKKEAFLFNIIDNGIGIRKDDQNAIFTIFKKANQNDVSENTGIGLASCKKIAEMHKGEIWVSSKPSEGSTFSFTISKYLKRLPKTTQIPQHEINMAKSLFTIPESNLILEASV